MLLATKHLALAINIFVALGKVIINKDPGRLLYINIGLALVYICSSEVLGILEAIKLLMVPT